jgi:divalent metal cation (Fe/Co/Zn/Cd) transporter
MPIAIEDISSPGFDRSPLIRRAVLVEWLTISWMMVESAVAIWSGKVAHSVSLTAFGLDSLIEMTSAGVLIWRLNWELGHDCTDEGGCEHLDRVELRASRIAALLLLAVCAYVVVEVSIKLWNRSGEDFSVAGLAVAVVAIPVMLWLSAAKRRLGCKLESGSLNADAAQGVACWYLALIVIVGLLAQRLFGMWWVDGVGSLVIVAFLLREAREAWEGNHCC